MQIEQHLRNFLEDISKISGLDNYLLFDKRLAVKDYYLNDNKHYKNSDNRYGTLKRWTFSSSVLFAFTILTTIGLSNFFFKFINFNKKKKIIILFYNKKLFKLSLIN